jgi:nitrile hydratase subunit beta
MNGVHDLGGMDGFGAIQRETDEPVFHENWEARVFAIGILGAGLPPSPVDAFRHRIERLDPARYLGSSYYERWLAAAEDALIETGTISSQEIEARIQQLRADPDMPVPRREDPERAGNIARMFRAGNPVTRTVRQKPRFTVGDKVVTRNLNPRGHTRLPRYARGKRGTVMLHHGAHVFPDTNAHGLGENPQHLYTVRISASELWGGGAEPNQSVLIDLWEGYLDTDKTVTRPAARKNQSSERKGLPPAEKPLRLLKSARTSDRALKGSTAMAQKSGRGTKKSLKPAKKLVSARTKPAAPKRKH